MSTALVWKNDRFYRDHHTARKLSAVHGQYAIWQLRDSSRFRVWHRRRESATGELSGRALGDADTLDQAKEIAQAHADQYGRKGPAA
jgi:hypothetical protein